MIKKEIKETIDDLGYAFYETKLYFLGILIKHTIIRTLNRENVDSMLPEMANEKLPNKDKIGFEIPTYKVKGDDED